MGVIAHTDKRQVCGAVLPTTRRSRSLRVILPVGLRYALTFAHVLTQRVVQQAGREG
jgi:hypothetical protein